MSKASLETLARTMSIAFLCLAVVTIGREQVNPASAAKTEIFTQEATTVKEKPKTKAKPKFISASKRNAPTSLAKRGIWLKELLYEAGFRGNDLKEAWAIAMKESTGRPNAYNGNRATGDNSYGIFQINMIGSLGEARREKFNLKSNKELFDPLTNAKIAHYMSRGGEDWSSWDIDKRGYNGGVSRSRYQQWLTQYPKG